MFVMYNYGMVEKMADKLGITEAVKEALAGSGVTAKLKKAMFSKPAGAEVLDLEELKTKAQAAIQDIEQLINTGTLDTSTFQKLSSMLSKLHGVLQKGAVTPEALAAAVSEARSVIVAADASIKAESMAQRIQQAWHRIEQYNKEINDNFEKMREAGIDFDEKLWKKHKELTEYLKLHPQDIERQKELNAIDDQLLRQAESQLKDHPNAQPFYDDAKDISDRRHQEVKEVSLMVAAKSEQTKTLSADDWTEVQGTEATVNEIVSPTAGKQKTEVEKPSTLIRR